MFSEESQEERYQIIKTLGQGGMGLVQLVYDSVLKRNVAMKTIKIEDLRTEILNEKQEMLLWRLKKEAEITSVLEHPNIVPLYDLQKKKNGEVYFTMRKIQGETLSTLLNQKKQKKSTLDQEDILTIFNKVCDAVAYAHSQGIIHRDLKPDNVMVGQFGEVYVMDWGIAKQLTSTTDMNATEEQTPFVQGEDLNHLDDQNDIAVTRALYTPDREFKTLGGIGTFGYMPPEQAKNSSEVKEQADIYALGKILKQCFTYLSPKQEFQELITRRQNFLKNQKETISLEVLRYGELPEDIQAIVEKATKEDWRERYTSVKEFSLDVERYRKNLRVSVRNYKISQLLLKWVKRNQHTVMLGGVFIFIFLGFWGYLKYEERKEFEKNLKQAREEQKRGEEEERQEVKMEHWLKGLYAIDTALLMVPKDSEVANMKLELSQSLVKSACETRDFQFASYFVRGVERLESIETQQKEQLKATVESAKTKSLREHQKRLNYWKVALKDPQPGMREEALLEINKMDEPEILEELAQEVKAGTQYFLISPERTPKQNEYYEMMAVALGSLENPNAGLILWQSLEAIAEKILRFKEENRSDTDVQYMVALVQALSHSKSIGFAEKLRNLRWQMGDISLFSKRTALSFRKLALLEGLVSKKQQTSFQDFYDRASLKLEIKDFDGAIADYTEAIRLNPQDAQSYGSRANAKKEKGDFDGAIEDYTEKLRLDPEDSLAYYNRGLTKSLSNNLSGALLDYTEAIRLKPKYPEAYTNRGLIKEDQGDFGGALLDYTEAIRINPQLFEAYGNRGNIKSRGGDFDGAFLDYTEAIRLNPQFADAYSSRGGIKGNQGDFDGAIEDFTKAIRLNPQHFQAYYNRGNIKSSKKDFFGAIEDYTESIRLNPQYAEAYVNRGICRGNTGDVEGSLLDYTEAIRVNPKLFQAYYNRGFARAKKADRWGAIEDLDQGLQLQANPQITRFLIDILRQQSREDLAQKEWEKAKATLLKLKQYLPPDHPEQKQLEQKLQQLDSLIQSEGPK